MKKSLKLMNDKIESHTRCVEYLIPQWVSDFFSKFIKKKIYTVYCI